GRQQRRPAVLERRWRCWRGTPTVPPATRLARTIDAGRHGNDAMRAGMARPKSFGLLAYRLPLVSRIKVRRATKIKTGHVLTPTKREERRHSLVRLQFLLSCRHPATAGRPRIDRCVRRNVGLQR